MLEQRVTEWTEQWKREGLQEGQRQGRKEGRREGLQEGRREGLQEGRKEGLQEGLREGEARLLMRQLEHKFGPLPTWARERVEGGSASRLLEWGERLLTAARLEEIFLGNLPD